MIEVGKSLISIDSNTGGNPAPCSPDLLFNGSNQGTVDGSQNILVNMEDLGGNPAYPVSVALVGNTLTIVVDIDTELFFNGTLKGSITDGTPINVNLQSSGGIQQTPISSTLVGNLLTIVIDIDTDIAVNSTIVGSVIDGLLINVLPVDSITNLPITPTSTILAGNNLTIAIATGTPSGVAFQIAQGTQYTSYANFDEGWRMQNGWFDYTPPANPQKRAFLDYTQGANSFYVLGEALTVAGVSSKTRFVSIAGNQTFSGGTNRDKVLIDKLTGLMLYRVYDQGNAIWTAALNNADAFSVTVDGVTYSDWYLISAAEAMAMFGNYRGNNWVDALTGVALTVGWVNGYNHTATTYAEITTQATSYRTHSVNGGGMYSNAKTNSYPQIFIRKCRNLIS